MRKAMTRVGCCLALALALGLTAPAANGDGDTTGPTVTTKKTEKGRESKIRVLLPTPESKLWFDDVLTRTTGTDRIFKSPALENGKRYTYRVTATWVEKGREVNHETTIAFRAGEDVIIDFRR